MWAGLRGYVTIFRIAGAKLSLFSENLENIICGMYKVLMKSVPKSTTFNTFAAQIGACGENHTTV